ncbi:hypothetical protein DM860_014058 [Cuscuta australis]|uniref:tRNA/rRNA methyltransferase SpoU type domain-containing protein n=1 Tax=Cuscuta australis TaxID=267555 RepID=A0A328DDF2_9ASTE|nr:hypothetical protein DM860_014058 [Cuscuta australis]
MQCALTPPASNLPAPLSPASLSSTSGSKQSPFQFKPINPSCCCSSSSKVLQKTITLPHHVTSISSTSNPFVKHCYKLLTGSSYRLLHGVVVVVGSTPIREICRFQEKVLGRHIKIECLLVLDDTQIAEEIAFCSARVVCVNSTVMKKLSGVQSIDSIRMIALFRIPSSFCNVGDDCRKEDCSTWFPFAHRILVLDGIQDPGNLGTLLRSALAFKWDGVFLLPGCCDPFNEKALRASRGACFQLPVLSGGWMQLQKLSENFKMKMLAGHPANDGRSKTAARLDQGFANSLAHQPLCLVLGSEGSGLSEKSREVCELVSIPMSGEFESLNASVAGGIFLYMLQPETRLL